MNRARKKKMEHVLGVLREINDNQQWVHPCTIENCYNARLSDDGQHIIPEHYVEYVYAFNELDIKWYLAEDKCLITMKQLRKIFEDIWLRGSGPITSHVSNEFPNIRADWSYERGLQEYNDPVWKVEKIFIPDKTKYWRFEMRIRKEEVNEN